MSLVSSASCYQWWKIRRVKLVDLLMHENDSGVQLVDLALTYVPVSRHIRMMIWLLAETALADEVAHEVVLVVKPRCIG